MRHMARVRLAKDATGDRAVPARRSERRPTTVRRQFVVVWRSFFMRVSVVAPFSVPGKPNKRLRREERGTDTYTLDSNRGR